MNSSCLAKLVEVAERGLRSTQDLAELQGWVAIARALHELTSPQMRELKTRIVHQFKLLRRGEQGDGGKSICDLLKAWREQGGDEPPAPDRSKLLRLRTDPRDAG